MRAVLVALHLQLEFGVRLIGHAGKLNSRVAYLHAPEDNPCGFVSREEKPSGL
jgi:hypothetical protein